MRVSSANISTPFISVLTCDGVCVLVDPNTLKPIKKPKKLHNMPITSVAFTSFDGDKVLTGSTDYTY